MNEMGWMFVHKERNESVLDFFKRELEYENENTKLTILKKSGKYYAVEVIHKSKLGQYEYDDKVVVGMVILTKNCPSDYHNFGYKVIEETCGPVERKCPESILKLLTPTKSRWANEWRNTCHEHNMKKRKKSISKGDIIKLNHPVWIEYGNIDTFRKVHSRKLLFKPVFHNGEEYKDYNCFPYELPHLFCRSKIEV